MRDEPNGDLIIAFGPAAPEGGDGNWIQTRPHKGWFPILRIYGPGRGLLGRPRATVKAMMAASRSAPPAVSTGAAAWKLGLDRLAAREADGQGRGLVEHSTTA